MPRTKSILKPLPPPKVSKGVSMDGAVWESVDQIRERIRTLGAHVSFDVNEIIEEAVKDAVASAHAALDRMSPSATRN